MKKTISILLIVTMLLSMAVAAMPIGAMTLNNSIGNLGLVGSSANGNVTILNGVGSTAATGTPGANVTGAPNTGIGAGTSGATWTALTGVGSNVDVNNITIPTVNATGAGNVAAATGATVTVPAAGQLPVTTWDKPWETESGWIPLASITDMEKYFPYGNTAYGGTKFYLTSDITINSSFSGRPFNKGEIVIDGNGHKLIFVENSSQTIFSYADKIELRNVILTGTLSGSSYAHAPIGAHHKNLGKVTLTNVYSDVNVQAACESGASWDVGGIVMNAGDGSKFTNVVFAGRITVPSTAKEPNIGGIVGETSGTVTFTNCVSAGTIIVESGAKAENIGGLVGKSSGRLHVTNSTVAGSISAIGGDNYINVGGFVGYGNVSAYGKKLNNCVSNVNITVGGKVKSVGGFAGYCPDDNYFDKITFNGSITVNADATFPTDSEENGVGGIIGVFNWDWMYNNCTSNGTITVNGPANHVGGFVGAYPNEGKVLGNCGSANNIANTNIVVNADVEAVGGFAGYVSKFNIEKTTFAGTISVTGTTTGIGGLAGVQKLAASRLTNCIVSGDISVKGSLNSVGGFIGMAYEGVSTAADTNVFRGSITVKNGSTIVKGGGVGCFLGANGKSDSRYKAVALKNFATEAKADKTAVSGIVVEQNVDIKSYEGGIGGIVGEAYYAPVYFENVVNGAPISIACDDHGGNFNFSIGGIVGQIFGQNKNGENGAAVASTFTNVYNTGDITMASTTNRFPVAGILGYAYQGFVTYKNSGNTGDITSPANNYHVAGLNGYSDSPEGTSTFTNCFNTGDITITGGTPRGNILYVGGISANSVETQTFTNCFNTGDIEITSVTATTIYAAGISATSNKALTFTNCLNSGDIKIASANAVVGGIMAESNQATKISTSTNSGKLYGTAGTNIDRIGGIIGKIKGAVTVEKCLNTGTIEINKDSAYIGGIVGAINGAGTIDSCVNEGTVTAIGDGNGWIALGGISGYSNNAGAVIKNSLSDGKITYNDDHSSCLFVGGVVGLVNDNKLTVEGTKSSGKIEISGSATTNHYGIGGFVGWTNGQIVISDSISDGDIDVDGTFRAVAGFVAYTDNKAHTLSNCEFNGNIDVNGDVTYVSGMIGYCTTENFKFDGCKVSGNITVNNTGSTAAYLGGIFGYIQSIKGNGNPGDCCTNNAVSATISADGLLKAVGGVAGWVNNWTYMQYTTFNGAITIEEGAEFVKEYSASNSTNNGKTTYKQIDNLKTGVGAIIGVQSSDVKFLNAHVGGTVTINGEATYVGGVFGNATKCINSTINKDCLVDTDFVVNGGVKAIGGYAGRSGSTGSGMTNVTFEGSITLNETAYLTRTSNYSMVVNEGDPAPDASDFKNTWTLGYGREHGIGGLIGTASGAISFSNCKVTGNGITVKKGSDEILDLVHFDHHEVGIGGLLGINMYNNVTVTNALNEAPITVERTGTLGYDDAVGGIVGSAFGGSTHKFANADNKGTITLADNTANFPIGGILGYNYKGTATFENCDNGGKIVTPAGNYMVGGIHGYAFSNDGTVPKSSYKNCSFTGEITVNGGTSATKGGKGLQVGGIAGACEDDKSFENCVAAGKITVSGGTNKTVWVGGMLARLDKAITFNNCKVSTDITYSGTATGEIGGFAGYGNANSTFNNCTFDGSIEVADTTSAAKVGGYIANSNGRTFTFNNSSSEGDIIANPAGGYHIGGFVAYTWGTEIFDGCYYDGSIEHSGSAKAIGGFVGWHATGSGKIEIKNSVSAGSIDVTGTSDGVGGFVGIIEKVLYEYPLTITDSTASTEITVSGEGKVKNVGGFVGYFTYDSAEGKEASRGAKLTVKDSEFVGAISIVDNAEVTEVAGIVGKIEMVGKQIEKLDENGDVVLDDKDNPVMVEKTDEILVIIDGCYTDGTITVSSKANDIAGYIAWIGSFVEIKNSTNSIDITMTGTVRDSWLCLAGFVGRKGSKTLTVTGCTNEGNITQDYDDGKFEKYILVGGVLSVSNGGEVDINATVNSGDIEIDAFCADYSGIGGILGWSNTNVAIDSVISYGDVVHNGDAAGVGGIAGYVSDNRVLTVTNCMTLATEGAKGVDVTHINNRDTAVGGIVGYCGTADSTISNCYNELPVTLTIGENAITKQRLGGIVGRAHAAELVITECVNAGALNYAGITSGIVGQHTSGALSVVRCVNLGDLSEGTGKDPILNSAENVVCKDNVYLIDNFDGYSVYGTALSAGRELDAAINATKVIASYGFDKLADAIDDADKFFASVDDRFIYAEFSWNQLNNAYNYAVAVNEKVGTTAIVIDENGDAKLNLLTQAEVNNAYYGLVDALDSMFKDGEMVALLEGAIAEAEKFMNANANTAFMPEAWTVFANVLAEAKTVAADDNISTAVDPAYMQKLATDLENAMKILVENKGGYIFTGDEFSKMNGQDGIFYLMADVKVTDTVNGFSGILNGNGYTVTVEKNSLFDNFSGTVSDITVAGDADGAAAVFGTASGDAEISNIIVTVKSFTAEVLFAGAAKDTEVVATNVLAAGEAKALAANGVTLKNAYLTGVEYYSVAGVKKTDGEIAKGLAAYNINKAFGENLLVQVIGKDTYPVMGAPAADGSNVVKLTDDGKLENPVKFFITDGEEPKFEEVPEIKPVTEMLENAIGRAEALKEADYEAASWTAFKAILASAKATLANANATQDALDNATSAVNIAIASLKAKVEVVVKVETDYSKLDAAIAAAKALKEADYTVESWTVLKMMLEAAEAAKTSDQQVMVNSAVAALENATLRLKTVKVEEKPEANKPEAPATTDETGCGSVVTGSAIAIAAVLALGAGVAFKKKED